MEATTLVLLGRTGNGKSSTGNSILGWDAFTDNFSFSSGTKECKLESRTWKDRRQINVIDTPGLFDTHESKEFVDKELVKCIDLAKDGIHAILLVVYDFLQILFGPKITNYMVVVFTGGDMFERHHCTLEEKLKSSPKHLKQLLNRCNSRMVLFDNMTTSKEKKENQITKLLQQVDSIAAENERQPYTNELFKNAQEMSEQVVVLVDREAEQIKLLKQLMERNKFEMEERVKEITKTLKEQSSLAQKEIARLMEELEKAKDALESTKCGNCWKFF